MTSVRLTHTVWAILLFSGPSFDCEVDLLKTLPKSETLNRHIGITAYIYFVQSFPHDIRTTVEHVILNKARISRI